MIIPFMIHIISFHDHSPHAHPGGDFPPVVAPVTSLPARRRGPCCRCCVLASAVTLPGLARVACIPPDQGSDIATRGARKPASQ